MNLSIARCGGLLALSFVWMATGCGGGVEDKPEVYKVSGKVTYKGDPVEGATVSFHTEDSPRVASGKTDAEGKYELTTFSTGDGAVAGLHKVAIKKQESTQDLGSIGVAGEDDPSADYGKMMDAAASGKLDKMVKNELPKSYADPETSGLTRTVVAGEGNTFDFEIK